MKINKFLVLLFTISLSTLYGQQKKSMKERIGNYIWTGDVKSGGPVGIWEVRSKAGILFKIIVYINKCNAHETDFDYNGSKSEACYCKVDKYNPYHLIPNGLDSSFYVDGKLEWTRTFVDGMEDGPFIVLSESGDTMVVHNLKKGTYNGAYREFYENSKQLKETGLYINGYKTGEFYPQSIWLDTSKHNFNILRDSLKRSGLDTNELTLPNQVFFKNKNWFYWSQDGKLILKEEWDKGKLLLRTKIIN
jgi:antitoxin component YwqK of YwqJK toxin-antitoxin module